jgi:hypothetical protein
MPYYKIDVDEEIWRFLKKRAEPFEDTPNSVLRRILLEESGHPAKEGAPMSSSPELREFPRGIPKALTQVLEVIDGVHRLGMSRMQATNLAARKRNTAPQTIIDKYARQLGKRTHEVDELLRPENLAEFQSLLEKKFPQHKDDIKGFFRSFKK